MKAALKATSLAPDFHLARAMPAIESASSQNLLQQLGNGLI